MCSEDKYKVSLLESKILEKELVIEKKQRALAEAGIILEALDISIEWELSPVIKREIRHAVLLVREALYR